MEIPAYMEIQRRHVEESRGWPDIRAYAADVLRRQKANKGTKPKKGSTSQHKSAPRNTNAAQQAIRPFAKALAPSNTIKKVRQGNTGRGLRVDGIFPSKRFRSHAPCTMGHTAMGNSNPFGNAEDDGKGMNEASFQKLLADIRTGLQTVPEPNDASDSPKPMHGSRRQNTPLPNTSPKTVEGCILCFTWGYSHCHHLNTVHKDVVPIWQNNASAVGTTTTAIQTPYAGSGQNAGHFLRLHAGTSSAQNSGSPVPGASKNGRIQKAPGRRQGRGRKNLPAVAARQNIAQELAQMSAAALIKSSSQATAKRAPGKSVRARSHTTPQLNSVQPTACNAPEAVMGFIDTSHFEIPDVGLSAPPGSSDIADSLFEGMDVMFPNHLSLPMIGDLPSPEDFFYGT